MTKKRFCFKNTFFAQNALFRQKQFLFLLIQAPNMSKHISRNRGATVMTSRKTAPNFCGGGGAQPKKGYSPKSVYWYKCFSV